MSASAQAVAAVRAAKNRRAWGNFAARRYAHNNDVPFCMYLLAVRVEINRAKRKELS